MPHPKNFSFHLLVSLLSQNSHLSNFTLNKSQCFKKQHKEKLVNLGKIK